MNIISSLGAMHAVARVRARRGTRMPAFTDNWYRVRCFDVNGKLKWQEHVPNGMTTEGLNNLLDVTLGGTTAETAWYVGLIDNSGFTTLAAADTLASHGGWTEVVPGTGYTGNRQTWTKNAVASGGAMSNSTAPATFPILATYTLNGAFLCSAATGTAGKLYGTASFSATRDVIATDSLEVDVNPSIS